MTTYRDEAQTGGDTTTWLYDEPSGLVTNKLYADGKGPSYSYTPNGSLATRTWARGVATAYAYDGWGSLTNTVYSDGTPSVSLAYDALGRQVETRDAAGVTAYAYDDAGSLTSEVVTGAAGTNVITRYWDAFGRPLGYALNGGRQTILAYDPATGRLASVLAAGSNAPFVWSYLPGTDLKSQLAYPNGLTASWAYDANSRLTQVLNSAQDGAVTQYGYAYDAASRRVSCAKSGSAMSDARTDIYGYNARSELVLAAKNAEDAKEHEYGYDDIGNRQTSSDLGTTRTYTANNLNQYTEISTLRVSAPPRETFIPQFDDDGNQTLIQTKKGVWSVTYNGDNRPVLWECGSTNILMSFDRMGRRVSYTETVGSVTNVHQTFVYDNYLQIADNAGSRYIWDPTEPVATRPLVWLHGGNTYSYTHDGNKNVSEVVDANGTVTAHYEYAPFGDVTVAAGTLSSDNPFRFSSEYADDALGLVYYNYRHYEPVTGRWFQRDLFYAVGKYDEYLFVNNRCVAYTDCLGLLSEGDEIKVSKGGLLWLFKSECGVIKVDIYKKYVGPRKGIMLAGVKIKLVFSPSSDGCCCKDGQIRWRQIITKDDEIPSNAGKLDAENGTDGYYPPYNGVDYYTLFDVTGIMLNNLTTYNQEVRFKSCLICCGGDSDVELKCVEWGLTAKKDENGLPKVELH